MPSSWLLFDRIRAYARASRLYQHERIFQDQSQLDRIVAGQEYVDFSTQAAILDQTNIQINRMQRYKDFELMDMTGVISLALDLYADESCLTGDTRIPLLDGTNPTIAELAERGVDNKFWVYAVDQATGEYVPAQASGARITGENVPVVKVTIDDGTVIRCTSDHLFMTKDGQFRRACDLKPGDSLKPLYRKKRYRGHDGRMLFDEKPYNTATAYEYFFNGRNFTSTHRWVYHHLNSDRPEVVHHHNFNSLDNSPENLKGMSVAEHDLIHRRYGSDNHSFNHITLSDIEAIMEGWSGPCTKDRVREACGIGSRVLHRILSDAGISWASFKARYHRCSGCNSVILGDKWRCQSCHKQYTHDYHQRRKDDIGYRTRRNVTKRAAYVAIQERMCRNCQLVKPSCDFLKNGCAYSPYCNECRPLACSRHYLNKSFDNHKVVSVEPDGVADKVYDIEVPGYHCFAAGSDKSWVIVHNSLLDPERKRTLIIRARSRRLKKELEDLFFQTLQWDSQCRSVIRYLCKFGDCPYEIVPTRNRDGVGSIRHMNVYNFTRIETRYGDLVGFFYQDEVTQHPTFLHPWQVMHLRLNSLENAYAPYGRCVGLDSKILTTNGYKNLGDCRPGDIVYSFNGIRRQETTVRAVALNNVKDGIVIRTKYRSIRVSDDHPILAVMEGAGGLFRRYVPAKHVVPGSKIVVHDPEYDDDNSYMVEDVVDHREVGQLEVGDIQVDSGYCNFVSDGVVVHNSIIDPSRKPYKQLRLMEDSALIYRICVRGDSLLWTPDGHKQIKDIKIGDRVYCFKDGRPQETTVVNWMCNGRDVIYRIKSQHREIYANATHPILVETSYANARDYDRPARFEFVDVKDIIVKRGGITKHHRFILPKIEHNEPVELIGHRDLPWLPTIVDHDFAMWFGFMIGDGYVSERPTGGSTIREVGFALGDDGLMNEKYRRLFAKYDQNVRLSSFDGDRLGRYYVYSKPFTEFMLANGYLPGAHNKRIPSWVFRLSPDIQEAFIDGYIDADGHRRVFKNGVTEAYEVDCCNEALMRDLKELCHRLGWKVGLVRQHDRAGGSIINKRTGRAIPARTSWSLYFTKKCGSIEEFTVQSGRRHTNYSEAILSVERVEDDLVYDVTVADDVHTIIVNGVPTAQTRGPEKRLFKIPVGLIPAKEVPEYMEMIARRFKRRRFYNPATGTFDETYSPLIQEDDFFLPMRDDGSGPEISTLPGAENLDAIADIEYFKKNMVAPLKIPFSRVGIGESGGEASEKSLSAVHPEFAKSVQWVQREAVAGLHKVAIIHLALRGYTADDMRGFELAMPSTSAIEELYRIETWQTRVQVMNDLKDLGWFPKEWIVTHFTDLTPDEILELKEMELLATDGDEDALGGGGGGGLGGGGLGGGGDLAGLGGGDALSGDMEGLDLGGDDGGGDLGGESNDEGDLGDAGDELGESEADIDRVIAETNRRSERARRDRRITEILQKWAQRRGVDSERDHEITSNFQFLLESKELDGLSKSPPTGDQIAGNGLLTEAVAPGEDDPGLLVGCSIPDDERHQAIMEVLTVLRGDDIDVIQDDEITDEDLP